MCVSDVCELGEIQIINPLPCSGLYEDFYLWFFTHPFTRLPGMIKLDYDTRQSSGGLKIFEGLGQKERHVGGLHCAESRYWLI